MEQKQEQPPEKKWIKLEDVVGVKVGGMSLPPGAQGPDCIWCNAPTRRTGACYTCVACGSTTSC